MNFVARIHQSYAETILDKVDLKLLRFFTAVAEAESFTRAAERMLVNQSHLSRQVMRLERALGHRLLVRRPRHVELTDAGQILLKEANFITFKLDGLQERIDQAVRGSGGSLVLGFTVADSFNGLSAKIVDAVARNEPRVVLNFCFEPRKTLIEAIADRRIHACFARPPSIARSDFRVDHLASEPILLAVPKHHRLAKKAEAPLSQAAQEPFVLWERNPDPDLYDDIVAACQRAGFAPRVIHHAPNPICALLLVAAGLGVSLIPASLNSIHADRVSFVLPAGEGLNTALALITRANEHIAGVKVLRKHALAMSTRHTTSVVNKK